MRILRTKLGIFSQLSIFSSTIILGHSSFVYYNRQYTYNSSSSSSNSSSSNSSSINIKNQSRNTFKAGDADEFLADDLKTGDIVLFRRNPLYYYLPASLYILLFRKFFNLEFDHCAIVVIDQLGYFFYMHLTKNK